MKTSPSTASSTYLLRLTSELVVKSPRVRARFVRQLVSNLHQAYKSRLAAAEAVSGVNPEHQRLKVMTEWSRVFVTGADDLLADLLPRTFGLSSFSRLESTTSDSLEDILATGERVFQQAVCGRSFAVKARRTGKQNYTSQAVCEQLGARLRPYARCVQLNEPEVAVGVEVRPGTAYFYASQVPGAGGLPLGASGRAVCLLSGGYDSVVAAWMMMKRGLSLDFVLCNLAGAAHERAVLQIAKQLHGDWGGQGQGRASVVHVVDFTPIVSDLKQNLKPAHVQVMLKRLFYRAANHIADDMGADAIITGECIGQVSSQTVQNLRAIEAAIALPILRPVVGMDKYEIMDLCRRIGCFDLCRLITEYCQLVPDRPATAMAPSLLDEQERRLSPALLNEQIATRRSFAVSELTPAMLISDYLFVDDVPENAVLIECGLDTAAADDTLHIALHELTSRLTTLTKAPTYVLHCDHGQQSAIAAEIMQRNGFTAYSLRGGNARLRQWKKRSPPQRGGLPSAEKINQIQMNLGKELEPFLT